MKGLLLKDWYMMKKYCRAYLVIAVVFIAASITSYDNTFFMFFPCLLCGMIPVTLLGYDERSRWVQYSETMPYTKTQIVSEKYLTGLLTQLATLIVAGIAQAIKMHIYGKFILGDFTTLMLLMLIVSTLAPSISLPFIFKLGVEKGRIAYYVMIGFLCCASAFASDLFNGQIGTEIESTLVLSIFAVVGIGIYIFSWCMSIAFYKKREI